MRVTSGSGRWRVWIEAAVWLVCLCLVLWADSLWSLAVGAVALWRAADHWQALDIDTRSSKSLDGLRHVWFTECHDEPTGTTSSRDDASHVSSVIPF